MSGPLFLILCACVVFLPVVAALVARLLARRGQRVADAISLAGFGVALVCALVVGTVDAQSLDLGAFGALVPRSGPVIDTDAFTFRREPVALAAGGASNAPDTTNESAAVPPVLPPTDATIVPTVEPTPTPEPTLEPTATLEPTPEPTLEPTPEPTLEPTATLEPTPEPTLEPTPEPTLEPTLEPTAPPPEPTSPPPPEPTSPPARTEPISYVVAQGDTLRSIAERFDVSVDRLLEYNGLTRAEGDSLRIGQRLLIPRGGSSAPAAPAPTKSTVQTYIVKSGDTLRGIAERFSISVDRLLQYNGLTRAEGDSLRVGQRLYIPAN